MAQEPRFRNSQVAVGDVAPGQVGISQSNTVLRNTYRLLSLTLAFSAIMAAVSVAMNLPHPGLLLTLGGYFGLLFLTSYLLYSR